MSYRFTMNFKKVKNDVEAMQIMLKIQNQLLNKETFLKWLDENYLFYIQELNSHKIDIRNIDKIKYMRSIQDIIEVSTKSHCCYWPKYNLLGVCGDWDYNIAFDRTIDFQNSTDQDYDYEEFQDIAEVIDNEIEKAKKYTISEIKNKHILDSYFNIDELDSSENFEMDNDAIEYIRKTYIYTFVYNLLDLSNWLYKKEFKKENMFAFNFTIPIAYTHYELYEWFIEYVKNNIEKIKMNI